ncbi:MAG: hypothetical protein FJ255_06720 [Phycisphaerae bacterium]|nr:hypothetical protein [Phycisphaerae bacterium]
MQSAATGASITASPSAPPSGGWLEPAAYSAGGLLVVAGLVVLALSRGAGLERMRLPFGRSISRGTAAALGFSLMVVGYHVGVWLTPLRSVTIHVPADLWWVVVSGAALAVAGSMGADALESRHGG